MDANTLHQVDEVMVDKVAVAYGLALGLICQAHKIPFKMAILMVHFCGTILGLAERDVAAVDYAIQKMTEDPEFLSKHHATEEQIIRAMWPDRKVS
ncbi:MAG: hypothetical protein KKD99_08865 [Proteobacteria bacterium]|nr:hypothetical protein [Pseudomonadota bacterium]MBU4355719.1 hypothetical protein [Pseudomonadota bacterium]MBU4448685.1 hypothetical protein [Pseudomonadota bacterium]